MKPILSLCLPTNGIIEWVFPVLDSIYNQNVDNSLFEIIVTNNGNNEEFHKMMMSYSEQHSNLIYKKTDAYMFSNQLEALKLASGEYLKFVNHRALFTDNSLEYLINIIKNNLDEKPVIYFSNGALGNDYNLNSFDEFVQKLRRFASWTTGVGIWLSDYKDLPKDLQYDTISPHSVILYSKRNKTKYLIKNFIFSKEITTDQSKKGTYDLFKAFAVEELTITLKLFIDGDISAKTLKYVKKDYEKMVYESYTDYIIRRKPCSYNLKGFDDSMGIYYNKTTIILKAWLYLIPSVLKDIKRMLIRK